MLKWEDLTYRKSTVAIIIRKDRRVLIVQKNSYKADQWDFPGGGIDGNETPDETILRELKEELGSNNFVIKMTGKETDKYDWPKEYILERFKKHGKTFLGQERVRFLVEFTGDDNEIKIQEKEIRKYKWVEIKDLEKYLVFPGYFEKIKKVLKEFELDL